MFLDCQINSLSAQFVITFLLQMIKHSTHRRQVAELIFYVLSMCLFLLLVHPLGNGFIISSSHLPQPVAHGSETTCGFLEMWGCPHNYMRRVVYLDCMSMPQPISI